MGSSIPTRVDVRIVAATHQDLEALIEAGRFREDLYYRLNVIPMQTPPLRQRREDILELALFFVNEHAGRTGKTLTLIEPEAVEMLMAYDWPGNCRELENVIERAVILADRPALTIDDLPPDIRLPGRRRFRPRMPVAAGSIVGATMTSGSSAATAATVSPDRLSSGGRRRGSDPTGDDDGEQWNSEYLAYERQRLIDALNDAGGNKSVAARLLAMPRSTFFSKLKKHGIV